MRVVLAALLLTWAGEANAQVGLTSGEARISVIARVPSGVSVLGVSSPRVVAETGQTREASVAVRLSASNGYHLVVRGRGLVRGPSKGAERIWVKAIDGQFRELGNGNPVAVAYEEQSTGEHDMQVLYRIESAGSRPVPTGPLPVSYEIAVKPVM